MGKKSRREKRNQVVAAPQTRGVDDWGWDHPFGSSHSASGVDVNPVTALNATAVLACVAMLAEDFAKLTPILYRLDGQGGRVVAQEHELYPLLYKPNRLQNYFEFAAMMQLWRIIRGNAYAVKIRDARGRVAKLVPVASDWVQLWEAPDGEIYYRVTPNGLYLRHELAGQPFMIPQEDMLHLRDLSMNAMLGVSRIVLAKEAIGLSLAIERTQAQFMGQGAQISGILTTDQKLSEPAAKRMQEDWKNKKSGLQNAGKVLVLEQGLKYQPIAMTSAQAEIMAARGFQLAEVCRLLRIPAHMAGDLSKSTNNNILQQSQEYINLTLSTHTECWRWALDVAFDLRAQGVILSYDMSILTRADVTQRYANYARGISAGFLKPNEARVDDGKDPADGGDKLLQPSNLAAPGSQATGGGADGGGRPEDGSPEQKL